MTLESKLSGAHVVVAAHDSGGAEVLSAWLAARALDCELVLAGPAVGIFARRMPGRPLVAPPNMGEALRRADCVLTGTGWSSDLERSAIASARERGTPVAAYLDHWTNYRQRFERGGRVILPDEIWVGDAYAERIAREHFPGTPVVLQPNLYFVEMQREVERAQVQYRGEKSLRVLYVTEPTSAAALRLHGDARYWGYTESEALEGYLRHLQSSAAGIARLAIRQHPAEPPDKYAALIAAGDWGFEVGVSPGRTLVEDCAWAEWVVGCDSMAMAIAVQCGRRVFCAIPATGPRVSLPFPQIERLFPQETARRQAT